MSMEKAWAGADKLFSWKWSYQVSTYLGTRKNTVKHEPALYFKEIEGRLSGIFEQNNFNKFQAHKPDKFHQR